MQAVDTIIVGAGASGIMAAISARRLGRSVVLLERLDKPGRKILATGGGRCNLANEDLDTEFYSRQSRNLVASVYSRFGLGAIKDFFQNLGLFLVSQDKRIFPSTNQASSVLSLLEMQLSFLKVPVLCGFNADKVTHSQEGFEVVSGSGAKVSGLRLIIAGGGKSYPSLGSNGSCYRFASQFSHTINLPVPSAVALVCPQKAACQALQGQKIKAGAKAIVSSACVSQAEGELLFTKYGLSGTCILDISREISLAVNSANEPAEVWLDLVPFLERKKLAGILHQRMDEGWKKDTFLLGILPDKFSRALPVLYPKLINDPFSLALFLKEWKFPVSGTRGWNEAEFTAGGIPPAEIKENLESRYLKNLFFCGEIIDVGARRGGYNLAWAWASGFCAGAA